MKSGSRRTAAVAVIATFALACASPPDPEPIGTSSSAVTSEPLTFDAVSGFPFRSSDRQVPFAQLAPMLHEALITLPGSYAALPPSYVALTPDKLDPFLDFIAQNTLAHRVAGTTGRARIVTSTPTRWCTSSATTPSCPTPATTRSTWGRS